MSCDLEDVKMLMGNRLDGVPQCVVCVCCFKWAVCGSNYLLLE